MKTKLNKYNINILIVFILMIIILFFLFLNKGVVFIFGQNNLNLVQNDTFINMPNPAPNADLNYIHINSSVNTGNLVNNFSMKGYVLLNPETREQINNIYIILKDINNTYSYRISADFLRKIFINTENKIKYEFQITFSTINIKNSTYQLFVSNGDYIIETEHYYQKSGKAFNKIDVDFSVKFKHLNSEVTFLNLLTNDNILHSIDDKITLDTKVALKGWAFIKDYNPIDNEIFVLVENSDGIQKIFDTYKMLRPDVGNYFNDSMYSNSGFISIIPLTAFSKGENFMTIVIKHQYKLFKAINYTKIYR